MKLRRRRSSRWLHSSACCSPAGARAATTAGRGSPCVLWGYDARRCVASGLVVRSGGALGLLVRCTWLRKHTADFAGHLQGAPPLLILRLARADRLRAPADAHISPTQHALLLVPALASVSANAAAFRCRLVRARNHGCNAGALAITGAELGVEGAAAAVSGRLVTCALASASAVHQRSRCCATHAHFAAR